MWFAWSGNSKSAPRVKGRCSGSNWGGTESLGYAIPSLMEDEDLSSYWGRMIRLNGATSARLLAREILGAPSRHLSSDLPTHLGNFIERVGDYVGLSLSALVSCHTAYPAYAVGLDPQEQADLLSRMISYSPGPRHSAAQLCAQMRFQGSTFSCHSCRREQERLFGFSYLLRRQQLPGVGLCTVHLEPLIHEVGGLAISPPATIKEKVNNEIALARSYESITNLRRDELEPCRASLRARLGIRESSRICAGDVHIHRTVAALTTRFSAGFLLKATTEELCNESNVVRALRRLASPSCALSPLWCAYLWGFTVDPPSESRPRPLPIPQRASAEAIAKVLNASATLTEASAKLGLSVTTLAVHARRLGIDFSWRPKGWKPGAEDGALLCLAAGLPIGEICEHLHLSQSAVYRILRASSWALVERKKSILEGKRELYRRRWQDAKGSIQRRPKDGVVAAGVWLKRHDAEWLSTTAIFQPSKRGAPKCLGTPRVASRPYLRLAKKAMMSSAEKWIRRPTSSVVSTTLILRQLGHPNGGCRSPLTAVASNLSEKAPLFAERRLSAGLARLVESRKQITISALVRSARIRRSTVAAAGIDAGRWIEQRQDVCVQETGAPRMKI